jgi:hypothetical protein
MKEQRKLERFDFEVPARIEASVPVEGREVCDLSTSNISAGGAFFRTTDTLPQGTKVKVNLVLPLDRIQELVGHSRVNVRVEGTVLRSGSAGMAVSFSEDYQILPLQNRLD